MSEKRKSIQVITDPLLEPFFITKDEYSYAIKKNVTSDPNHRRSKGASKEYEKTLGYFSKLPDCLTKIAKLKSEEKDFNSLNEYINEYKNVSNQINQYVNGIKSKI